MNREQLAKRIKTAAGEIPADLVIKNCKVVNVYNHSIQECDVALCGGVIAGLGEYSGTEEIDGQGKHLIPGLIEGHIHIESSMLTPEEFGRLMVPCGTTTAIADPHEIVNVCGISGLEYMVNAAEKTAMDIKYMIPSCVPSTIWENAGAELTAEELDNIMADGDYPGLGEFMDSAGVLNCAPETLDKLVAAINRDRIIDGHAPGMSGKGIAAYASTGIRNDHECENVEEMNERIANGMYVMLRYGSACHDLPRLAPGVDDYNARRCVLASDDRLAATMIEKGDLNDSLKLCVELGIDPITAVQMGTINAAECFGLRDRGAIAPGLRGDMVLVDDLEKFNPSKVWIEGQLVAEGGKYLPEIEHYHDAGVKNTINVSNFSEDRLRMHLEKGYANVMKLNEGSVVTTHEIEKINVDDDGDFVFDKDVDIVKMAVIERHHGLGNVGTCLVKNYGIRKGAIALTIAHDSHNIIVIGTNNRDMTVAVEKIIDMNGGIVLVDEGEVTDCMPLQIGGLMSNRPGEEVAKDLERLQQKAVEEFGVNPGLHSIMTLSFLALPVIPELKLTDMGLFDVRTMKFMDVQV